VARVTAGIRRADAPLTYQAGCLLCLLGLWWLVTDLRLVRPSFLPPPASVWGATVRQWRTGVLAADVLATLRETGVALVLSCAVGVPVGTLLGLMPRVYRAVEPVVGLYLAAPLVAFVSIFIVWFGFGSASVVALGFAAGVAYVVVTASLGVQGIDRTLLRVARVFCRSRAAGFWKVVLPGAMTSVAAGIKLAAGRVVVGVVVGEMFGANAGLGARLVNAANFFDIPTFYAAIGLLAMTAFGVVSAIGFLEGRINRFRAG
jgi:ABC-type nitrate/sulfonate/bicarbonate transport system permease component